jgi:pimeloyl-ACP methyl ester carboxylesterase
MTPFYFGTGARRLFGIYEPAASAGASKRAAVLCHPWGSEYLYAHRTMRQLAVRLAAAGFHTLRFDFFGTGDSAGEMIEADLGGWETDTELAMEELGDIVGTTRVTLIGLRLGATVAATVAARRPGAVDALVLWDPVVSGPEYLRHLESLGAPSAGPRPDRRPAVSPAGQALEIRGFPLIAAMTRDLQSIALGALLAAPVTRTLMVVSERRPSHESLLAVPAGHGAGSLAIEFITAVCPWIEDPSSMGVMPVEVIQRIVKWTECP